MKIIYCFNKRGFEAKYWQEEIANSTNEQFEFIPFNHEKYIDTAKYIRAQLLDNLYYERNSDLLKMYNDLEKLILESHADVLIVDNAMPYHPDFLRKIDIYKVLRTSDGPISAYDRDFAYLHAYDHILYHSPAYSRDMGMEEKLLYCGAKKVDFWPLGSYDALCDPLKLGTNIFSCKRDIDVVFIGALHIDKMPQLAKIIKKLGKKLIFRGLTSFKKNIYFNLKYGFPGWIRPLQFENYVPIYQRAKIGINLHNRGEYTVGNYRMFDLPANGVMQISDGGSYINKFFTQGEEIVSYDNIDDLIEKVQYYLVNEEERERIALNGFLRVQKDYKIRILLNKAAALIQNGLESKESI